MKMNPPQPKRKGVSVAVVIMVVVARRNPKKENGRRKTVGEEGGKTITRSSRHCR